MKKMVALGLAAAFTLTACSNNQTSEAPAGGSSGESGASKPAKLSLNWSVTGGLLANVTLPSADKDFVKKTIEEKFNVDLKIDYMGVGKEYHDKLNATLAGGSAPDLFIAGGAESQKYINDGITANLTPFFTKEALPNYYKWVSKEEVDAFQLKQGEFVRGIQPFQRNTYAAWYIRKDWLDKLGLKAPKNYEELTEVLIQFTKNDPDGNGKPDTYGFTTAGNGVNLPLEFPQWLNNGLVADFMIQGDRYVDNRTDLKVQQVIDQVVEWINLGIVDPDWFLNKGTAPLDKAAQGKVGFLFGATKNFALDSVATSVQNRTKALDPKADWQPIFPLDQPVIWKYNVPEMTILISKTTADKNPEKVKRSVEILDWLTSEEGFLLTHYGQEGKHYTRSGNKITLNAAAFEADIAKAGNWINVYGVFTPDEPEVLGLELIDSRVSEHDRAILKTVEGYPKHNALPPVSLVPPAGINIGDFRKEMSKYHAKAVLDDKSGKNWPQYREELMTKFKGRDIFNEYTKQLNSVLKDKQLAEFK
ncbi:ABC-type glycerol-3-phosphate transport system, substrate-binding protein [Paenibacillus sp. UNCCL117]|uniref:extracellular solute-binding protein n=1 Tax=unclassified Paenibacillus TaxID=185978 RepID=UPI0008868C45|nr:MULTISPECIES: extracellular solute-binding protein [unclassified Paenibacillus]SDE11418.1 ABC-type glycerol-3-phosphate transport system, substrate-binding protein [Paenibacillus sp. cl123]SFW59982.1 ABC-type glycerol-3-phosphate transport system, substrate-binding protein [Paenibacillus sp. UNCCL117]